MNELEIKILNIDKNDIQEKLTKLNATYINDSIQKIYTYDCYESHLMYELALKDYKLTKSKNSIKKILNVLEQLKPVFDEKDKNYFYNLSNYCYLDEYIKNNINNINYNILSDKGVKNIIKVVNKRFFKWIRLRQTGNKVELTIKYIYNTEKDYKINDVKEIEIIVNDFDTANKIIEEMGYYHKKLVEKRRISYILDDVRIEIDEWPLIPPYIEIEGDNEDNIYSMAKKLGFNENEFRIMNTEDVYLENGLDLTQYEILTFERSVVI